MRKVILSVAPVSGSNSYYNPDETANEIINCYKAGATEMHIHVRGLNNKLSADTSYISKTLSKVRKETDMLIEVSTGGVSSLTMEERCNPCREDLVELTSLNVSTINLGTVPYINRIDDVRYCVDETIKHHKHPETEIFEIGHLYTLKDLDAEFNLPKPMMISLVLGFKGTMPTTETALRHMVSALSEVFPEGGYKWGLIEASRDNFDLMGKALDMGASIIRVGFEDSPFIAPNVKADSNVDLVKKAIECMHAHGAKPMNPREAREMLQIPKL